jgi:hypothetical protein
MKNYLLVFLQFSLVVGREWKWKLKITKKVIKKSLKILKKKLICHKKERLHKEETRKQWKSFTSLKIKKKKKKSTEGGFNEIT